MSLKKYLLILILISFLNLSHDLSAVSLVYSMKIRRIFALSSVLGENKKSAWIGTSVPIIYKRKRHIVQDNLGINVFEKKFTAGSLFNFRYVTKKAWWFEITTGLEGEYAKSKGTTNFNVSRTGLDDILLAGGHNWFPTDNVQLVLYGIAGFPFRKKVTLLEALEPFVGTRFYGLGAGGEISYAPLNNKNESFVFILQTRYVHFFNRKWFPILPCNAKIQPGDIIDILYAMVYRRGKSFYDAGYNPTFFINQAALLKTGKIKTHPFIRQGMYASYYRLFEELPIIKKSGLLGAGFAISQSKEFRTKIFSAWLNISAVF